MKTLHALALLALLPAAAFVSCKTDASASDTTRRPAVDPPLANLVPYRDFNISADAGDTILLDEGTALYVPAGIFVDKNGRPVKGDVQLHYRAFYTPGEIIASGITMFYDSAGTEHTFSSAGMFELTGTQGGEPVTIAPGKNISMDFGTNRNDASFSFYALDTTASKWNFINTPKLEANAMREQITETLSGMIAAVKPMEPRQYDPKKPVLDLNVDINNHPELAGYTSVMWQWAGSGADPDKAPELYSTEWTSAKLQVVDSTTFLYDLDLSAGDKSFSTNVYPALRGEHYEKALTMFRKNIREFEAQEKVRQDKIAQRQAMAEFQYNLTLGRFGIYNLDCFTDVWELPMVFHFEDTEFESNRENVVVFMITANKRMVAGYNAASSCNVRFTGETKNYLVAIMRGTNQVAVLDDAGFRKSVNKDDKTLSSFTLRSHAGTVSDNVELDALIASL